MAAPAGAGLAGGAVRPGPPALPAPGLADPAAGGLEFLRLRLHLGHLRPPLPTADTPAAAALCLGWTGAARPGAAQAARRAATDRSTSGRRGGWRVLARLVRRGVPRDVPLRGRAGRDPQ